MRRTQHDGCKEHCRRGDLEKRQSRKYLWAKPQKRDAKGEGGSTPSCLVKRKGEPYIHSFGQITDYPSKGLCISFPSQGNTSREMKK